MRPSPACDHGAAVRFRFKALLALAATSTRGSPSRLSASLNGDCVLCHTHHPPPAIHCRQSHRDTLSCRPVVRRGFSGSVQWQCIRHGSTIVRRQHDTSSPSHAEYTAWHYFAIRTLLNWYRSNADVEAHLPELATYLGHVHVRDCYWYLSAVPELLKLATLRWERAEKGAA